VSLVFYDVFRTGFIQLYNFFKIFLAIGISTFSKALAAREKDSKSQPVLACELKELKVDSEKKATAPLCAKPEAGTNKEKQNEIESQKSVKSEASIVDTMQKKVEDQPVKTTTPGPQTVKTDAPKVAEATSIPTEIEKKVNVELNKVSSLEKEAQQKVVDTVKTVKNETEIKQKLDDTVQPLKTTTIKTDAPKVAEAKSVQMEVNKAPSVEKEKEAQKKIVDTIKTVQNEISLDTKVEASIPKANTENK